MIAENTRSGSPLLGQLDINSLAVGGWSMGGGGAQLAAAADPSIKAVVALCPWLNSGSLSPADINHAAPVLFFSAENDGIAPPVNHADVQYDYTPLSTSKMLFEIAGAGHQAANDPINGDEYIGKIAVSWLKNYLVGEICYCPLVFETPPSASQYLLNVTCGCPEDVNGDGVISVPDILVLLAEFGCVSGCSADINGDNATNVQDLLLLLSVFGSAC
ncbi:MAG: hypothetical protein P8L80_00720 [Flavobacteriales bacterium]|nr:hypothetical protein [Flavobacteriales bacterium]